MRRFTRLTNGFSKKVENHASMVVVSIPCFVDQPVNALRFRSRVWFNPIRHPNYHEIGRSVCVLYAAQGAPQLNRLHRLERHSDRCVGFGKFRNISAFWKQRTAAVRRLTSDRPICIRHRLSMKSVRTATGQQTLPQFVELRDDPDHEVLQFAQRLDHGL